MGGKSKAHKKKRISKHILEAQQRKKQEEAEASKNNPDGTTEAINNDPPTKKKKKSKKKNHIKDPKEAHNYLSTWKNRESAPGVWKFNKNTQSWLLRHMYDSEKVPKTAFGLLMEYLDGLQGAMRERTNEDAVRRALRYKEWEKNGGSRSGDGDGPDGEDKADEAEEKKKSKNIDADDEVDDDARFGKLSDHDKRKEYKRARKVIDSFKKSSEE